MTSTVGSAGLRVSDLQEEILKSWKIKMRRRPNQPLQCSINTNTNKVYFIAVPASFFSENSSTFGDRAHDVLMDPVKKVYFEGFCTALWAAAVLPNVTILCEVIPKEHDPKAAAYVFTIIDNKEENADEADEEQLNDVIAEGSSDAPPKEVLTFGAALYAIIMCAPDTRGNGALSLRALQSIKATDTSLSLNTFRVWRAKYNPRVSTGPLSVEALKHRKGNGPMQPRNLFSYVNVINVLRNADAAPVFYDNEDQVLASRMVCEDGLISRVLLPPSQLRHIFVLPKELVTWRMLPQLPRPDCDCIPVTEQSLARSAISLDTRQSSGLQNMFVPFTEQLKQHLTVQRMAVANAEPGQPTYDAHMALFTDGCTALTNVVMGTNGVNEKMGVSEADDGYIQTIRKNMWGPNYILPTSFTTPPAALSASSHLILWWMQRLESDGVYINQDEIIHRVLIATGVTLPTPPGYVCPGVCTSGPPESSKSFTHEWAFQYFPTGTAVNQTSISLKAMSCGFPYIRNKIYMCDEIPKWMIEEDPKEAWAQELLEGFKKHMTPIGPIINLMAAVKDGEHGKERVLVQTGCLNFRICYLMCTNHGEPASAAVSSRLHCVHAAGGKRGDTTLSDIVAWQKEIENNPNWQKSHEEHIRTVGHLISFHFMVASAMAADILPKMQMTNFNYVLHRLRAKFKKHGLPAINQRTIERMSYCVQTFTIWRAYMILYALQPGPWAPTPDKPAQPPIFDPDHMMQWAILTCVDNLECAMHGISIYSNALVHKPQISTHTWATLLPFFCSNDCSIQEWKAVDSLDEATSQAQGTRGANDQGKPIFTVCMQAPPGDDAEPGLPSQTGGCAMRCAARANIYIVYGQLVRSLCVRFSRWLFWMAAQSLEGVEDQYLDKTIIYSLMPASDDDGDNPDEFDVSAPPFNGHASACECKGPELCEEWAASMEDECPVHGDSWKNRMQHGESDGTLQKLTVIQRVYEEQLASVDAACSGCTGCRLTGHDCTHQVVQGSPGTVARRIKKYWEGQQPDTFGRPPSLDAIVKVLSEADKDNETTDAPFKWVKLKPEGGHPGRPIHAILPIDASSGATKVRNIATTKGKGGVYTMLSLHAPWKSLGQCHLEALNIDSLFGSCVTSQTFNHFKDGGSILLPLRSSNHHPELPKAINVTPPGSDDAFPVITRAVPTSFTLRAAGIDQTTCVPKEEVDDLGVVTLGASQVCSKLGMQVDEADKDTFVAAVRKRACVDDEFVPTMLQHLDCAPPWKQVFAGIMREKRSRNVEGADVTTTTDRVKRAHTGVCGATGPQSFI